MSWPRPGCGIVWSASPGSEEEITAEWVATDLRLTDEDVLVLAVGHRGVDVRPPGDVSAGGDQPVVEQVARRLLQAHVDQFDGLG